MAKKIIGMVTSDVQDKTIVVTVTHRETHPLYGKKFTVSKKFAAHDETNEAKKNDKVEIIETRPISRNKSFKLNRILEKAPEEIVLKEEQVIEPKEATV